MPPLLTAGRRLGRVLLRAPHREARGVSGAPAGAPIGVGGFQGRQGMRGDATARLLVLAVWCGGRDGHSAEVASAAEEPGEGGILPADVIRFGRERLHWVAAARWVKRRHGSVIAAVLFVEASVSTTDGEISRQNAYDGS